MESIVKFLKFLGHLLEMAIRGLASAPSRIAALFTAFAAALTTVWQGVTSTAPMLVSSINSASTSVSSFVSNVAGGNGDDTGLTGILVYSCSLDHAASLLVASAGFFASVLSVVFITMGLIVTAFILALIWQAFCKFLRIVTGGFINI